MKKCTTCGELKKESEFAVKTGNKKHSRCKECKRKIDRIAYKENRNGRADRIRLNARKQIKLAKEFVRKTKEGSACARCDDSRWYVLDFHHNFHKKDTISELAHIGASIDRIKREMTKCEILCSNCHREIHFLMQMQK